MGATLRNQVREALETLVVGNKNVYIQLMSIPDINQLRTILTEPPGPERPDPLGTVPRLPGAARQPALDRTG